MITCKNGQHTHTVNNGFVRAQPRGKGHAWGATWVLVEARHAHTTAIKQAFAIILSSLGKASFGC